MNTLLGVYFQILVLFLVCVSGYSQHCGDYHNEEMHIHTHKNGTSRCCVRRMCAEVLSPEYSKKVNIIPVGALPTFVARTPTGTHGVLCYEGSPESTTCVACSDEGYMPHGSFSFINMECILKRVCRASDGLVVVSNGSTTDDRECVCDLSRGYFEHVSEFSFSSYCEWRPCPAGQELQPDGNCLPCLIGSFKANESLHLCIPWTDCHALGLLVLHYGNKTHDNICEQPTGLSTTTLDPITGAIIDGDNQSLWIILIGFACALLITMPILVGVFICLRRRAAQCNESQASCSEKQTLDRDVSFSDTEEQQDNRSNMKGPNNLTIQIPTAPIQEAGDQIYPKSSTTPDSGIVSDLKLNGHGYGPVYTSSPIFGPNKFVECDSAPCQETKDGLPLTTAPVYPQRQQSSISEGSYKEPALSGVQDKALPTHLVIQNNGPVYLQYGNHNQLSAKANASNDNDQSIEYEFEENESPSFHTTV